LASNKEVVQRLVDEVVNAGSYPVVRELLAPDFAIHKAGMSFPPGPEASMDGKFRVYSSRTGQVLWEYDTVRDFDAVNGPGRGSAISGNGGAVVAGGMVYVQSGY
jgi:hypothetical protein